MVERYLAFYRFVLKMITIDRREFILFTAIYTLIVFLLSSFLLMRGALIEDIATLEKNSADLIVQRMSGGKSVNVDASWLDQLESVEGVTSVYERRFIHYFFPPAKRYFTLVGYSTFQNHSNKSLNSYLESLSLELDTKRGVIIGQGVNEVLRRYHYDKNIPFDLMDGSEINLPIIGVFTEGSALTTNDVILVPDHYISMLIGANESELTDIGLRISNNALKSSIAQKIISLFPNARVLDMKDIYSMSNRFYNQFSGIFLALLGLPVMTFIFLLFSRAYVMKKAVQRQIAILRVLGWPMSMILHWHLLSAFLIASIAFMLGVLLSYAYIIWGNGIGLANLFLGYGNLPIHYNFPIHYSLATIFYIAVFSIPPFVLASLYPAYRLGRKDAREVLQ